MAGGEATANDANLDSGWTAYKNRDYETALEVWQKEAGSGNVNAMVGIGISYLEGNGVPQNYETARQWLEKAAANGDTRAMRYIGGLYAKGNGVPQNYVTARQWNEKAAWRSPELRNRPPMV